MKIHFQSGAGLATLMLSTCLIVSCGSPASNGTNAATPDSINIYQSDTSYTPPTIPNRANSTLECENTHANNPSWGLSCTNYVALLAFNADNGVQDLPTNFNVPTTLPVFTPDDVEVAANYADLIDDRDVDMVGTGFGSLTAWGGFSNGGSVLSNCINYTSTNNSDDMGAVQLNNTGNWGSMVFPCDSVISQPLLCLCW